jgi:rRNA processing protein Krr1/Pno1
MPPRSPNTKDMTAAELQIDTETELDRIERWRAEELVRAGYEPGDALALAARHDIDLHFAVELIGQGCPYETALEILI